MKILCQYDKFEPMKIKVLDVVFGLIFASIVVFSFFYFLGNRTSGRLMLVVTTPQDEFIYPLDKDSELKFEGLEGITKVIIREGKACVVESPCANKNCINMGFLSGSGDWAACLPNDVILRVESNTKNKEFDVIAR